MIINSTAPATAAPIANDGQPIKAAYFWPEIDPAHARAAMRLDGTVTAPRLRHALVEAVAGVNQELSGWRQIRTAAGASQLAEVAAEQIDGESVLVQRWRRAVYATTAAELAERYRSFDTTGAGRQRADDLDSTADDLRADARAAIRAILAVGRATVELI
ncbi:head completion/stabilization protein [Chromobacterium sphagni]|uniref:Head completion/stabilization protein n=1 Tax=Chromobacterium sphagni TaxID=1903179 RepID=A0ABX3CEM7_9NEIS|nr:head completion/stabilization protein [Chromobacterium sphagni]OHX20447.1 hypothetical protein BI344_08230 [Chromobacterium sphagni]